MKISWKYFILLFLSFSFGFYGCWLLDVSYQKKLATSAAISEINYLKEIPFLIKKNQEIVLPTGHENLILKKNKNITLFAKANDFNNTNSIYDVSFSAYYKKNKILEFSVLIDARLRK